MKKPLDLQKLKEDLVENAKRIFKKDSRLAPVALVVTRDQFIPVVMVFETKEQREVMLRQVKKICQDFQAIAVMLVNESWAIKVKKEDKEAFDKEYAEKKDIANFDGKKEIASLIFETDLTNEVIVFDIDREKKELVNERRVKRGVEKNFLMMNTINKN